MPTRVYRLALPRDRWYQLRGLPLVGSECVCSQCKISNSSFVITRGSAMPFGHEPSRPSLTSSQETRAANVELPGKLYPTVLYTVKGPMIRPQRYSTLQKKKPISGYQPQVGSDRVTLIDIAVRTLGNGRVQHIVVNFTTT